MALNKRFSVDEMAPICAAQGPKSVTKPADMMQKPAHTLRLYDTMTAQKRDFAPQNPQNVTLYVCGPTVYNYAHIGNARPVVAFDVLFRLLRDQFGPNCVVYARNITDIDDKIIAKSVQSGEPIAQLTARFADIYRQDMAKLNALAPNYEPKATDYVAAMIEIIAQLLQKAHAYRTETGVWFHVPSMPTYGALSKRNLQELEAGARVDLEPEKRHPGDFALWKAAKPGEPAWDSPFGRGRPGWHIECSAMIGAVLGQTIDIHAGGHDLIFPHHENEIAQSHCANHAPLAQYWLHNGFLSIDSEKMSKSIGNVLLVHDLLKHYKGEIIRAAMLSAHYRQPLDWTDQLLTQAQAGLDRLYGALQRLAPIDADPTAQAEEVRAALADDLNTPRAMGALFGLATEANRATENAQLAEIKGKMLDAGGLLGLLSEAPNAWFQASDDLDIAQIERLVEARGAARAAKNWPAADQLRSELTALGVEVLDGPQGAVWRRIGR